MVFQFGSDFKLVYYVGNSYSVVSSVILDEGKWNHIAISWQSSMGSLKIYKNGNVTPAYTSSLATGITLNTSNGSMMLGQEQDCPGGCFDTNQLFAGSIDEIRVWNIERTGQQIADNFNKPLNQSDNIGLSLYYPFVLIKY